MPSGEDKIARHLLRAMNTRPPDLLRRAAAQFNQTLETNADFASLRQHRSALRSL